MGHKFNRKNIRDMWHLTTHMAVIYLCTLIYTLEKATPYSFREKHKNNIDIKGLEIKRK